MPSGASRHCCKLCLASRAVHTTSAHHLGTLVSLSQPGGFGPRDIRNCGDRCLAPGLSSQFPSMATPTRKPRKKADLPPPLEPVETSPPASPPPSPRTPLSRLSGTAANEFLPFSAKPESPRPVRIPASQPWRRLLCRSVLPFCGLCTLITACYKWYWGDDSAELNISCSC